MDSFLAFLADDAAGFALGRELAFVVSFKQVEEESGAEETFDRGEDAGPPGDDFWKKETMDLCFAAEEAGVRETPAASRWPAIAAVGRLGLTLLDCWEKKDKKTTDLIMNR